MTLPKPNSPTVFVGVDPGALGGIAVICGSAVSAITMPNYEQGVWDHLSGVISSPGNTVGALEQVGGFIKGNPSPGSAMFEFGDSFGCCKMALIGHGLKKTKGDIHHGKFRMVIPRTWQSELRIDPRRKSESDGEWKARLKSNAEDFFPKKQYPSLRITLRTADALLIAQWVKLAYTGAIYTRS